MMFQILVTVLIFSPLFIFIHELGHFLMAKLLRIKVKEFVMGSGPQLYKRNFRGVDVMINLFQICGHVKLDHGVKKVDDASILMLAKLFLIGVSGPMVNIVAGAALFPYAPKPAIFCIYLGLANLIPAPGSDGMLSLACVIFMIKKTIDKGFAKLFR